MLLKELGILAFIASVVLTNSCTGQDDGVVEVILIDGPGGYLPDIGDYTDNDMIFEQDSQPNEGNYMDDLMVQRYWTGVFDYWGSYLRFFSV
jgi:hypothetical protein